LAKFSQTLNALEHAEKTNVELKSALLPRQDEYFSAEEIRQQPEKRPSVVYNHYRQETDKKLF